MTKIVILTGLRANNDLHIGNYFGALLPIIDMALKHAGEYQINLFVPDLHSFTTPVNHNELYEQTIHNLKLFMAAGLPLDSDDIHIYRQSFIPAHSELTWILDCFTPYGQLNRMTQFKDRRAQNSDREFDEKIISGVSAGLFIYPVLMAADILLYGATYVPVGDDQSQHIEFARDIAERMNNKFGELFVVPEPVAKQHDFFGKDQGLRIKDLVDPTKKMSKSDMSDRGVIFLGDNPEAAAKKVNEATTDSIGAVHLDYEKQPGISNLLQIHALLSGETLQAVAEHHDGQESYGDLKKEVAEQVQDFLTAFQAKLAQVDERALLAKLEADEKTMNEVANATLLKAQKAVGLRH
jgi:tryptophanyl-tRNA synthetase